jgi:hypothetical protein
VNLDVRLLNPSRHTNRMPRSLLSIALLIASGLGGTVPRAAMASPADSIECISHITFARGSAILTAKHRAILDDVRVQLEASPSLHADVHVHIARGESQALFRARYHSVRNYLGRSRLLVANVWRFDPSRRLMQLPAASPTVASRVRPLYALASMCSCYRSKAVPRRAEIYLVDGDRRIDVRVAWCCT